MISFLSNDEDRLEIAEIVRIGVGCPYSCEFVRIRANVMGSPTYRANRALSLKLQVTTGFPTFKAGELL